MMHQELSKQALEAHGLTSGQADRILQILKEGLPCKEVNGGWIKLVG